MKKRTYYQYSFHNKVIKMDESLKKSFDEERSIIEEELDDTIVESEIFLETNSDKETSLANMVVDIGRRISGADFAFYNLGGYRTSWYPGSINSVDLFLMFPFDNYYVSFDMSGQEVLRMLKSINRYNIYPSSGLMQVFKKSGKQNILVDAKIYDGLYETNIEPYKTYRVCVNDFLFQGGSQFKRVREWYKPKNPLEYDTVRKLVTEYLKEMQMIKEEHKDTDIFQTTYEKVLSIINQVKDFIKKTSKTSQKLIDDLEWVIKVITNKSLYSYEVNKKKISKQNSEYNKFINFVTKYNEEILELNKRHILVSSLFDIGKKDILLKPSLCLKKILPEELQSMDYQKEKEKKDRKRNSIHAIGNVILNLYYRGLESQKKKNMKKKEQKKKNKKKWKSAIHLRKVKKLLLQKKLVK